MEIRVGRPTLLSLLALSALFAATVTLTAVYHDHRAARAEQHFAAGQRHASRGDLRAAVDEYRAALLLERHYIDAERALALSLLSLGRLDEAESYLTSLLQRDPVSGPLNLGLARILAARGSDAGVRRVYQRAIYGEWGDAPEGRLNARFELTEYLYARGASREELIAELLQLKAELPPGSTAAERRLASLFGSAGDMELAIEVLQEAAVEQPRDVALLADLAAAEVTAGRMTEARQTLRRALALEPDRQDLRERLTVVDRVLALDPTLPRLRVATRVSRARQLLRAVAEQTTPCGPPGEPPAAADRELAPAPAPAVAEAQARVAERLRRRAAVTAETADDDLALAVDLWSAAAECRTQGPEAEAISRVLDQVRASAEDAQP